MIVPRFFGSDTVVLGDTGTYQYINILPDEIEVIGCQHVHASYLDMSDCHSEASRTVNEFLWANDERKEEK